MKAILISINPQWVAKILNGEKTIEIRKKFPKDYVGWVYIYVTKGKDRLVWDIDGHICIDNEHYAYGDEELNGKVIARFWCDKVEEVKLNLVMRYSTDSMKEEEILNQSCLTVDEIDNYLWSNICCGKAIHITKLEIFDKPQEIYEFYKAPTKQYAKWCRENSVHGLCIIQSLTRAPQSWCYVEVDQ